MPTMMTSMRCHRLFTELLRNTSPSIQALQIIQPACRMSTCPFKNIPGVRPTDSIENQQNQKHLHQQQHQQQQQPKSELRHKSIQRERPDWGANLKGISDIPGPVSLPQLGSSVSSNKIHLLKIHEFWERMFKEYGPLIKVRLPGSPLLVATASADHVHTVMQSSLHDPRRHFFLSLKKVRDEAPNNYFQKRTGLLPENGAEWWRVRSRVQAPLMQPRHVAQYLPKVDSVTRKFMDRLETLLSPEREVPQDFLSELYKWALECVGLVALDRELGCLEPNTDPESPSLSMLRHINEVFGAVNDAELGLHTWKKYKTKPYLRLEAAHNAFLQIAAKSIEEVKQSLQQKRSNTSSSSSAGEVALPMTVMETFLQTEGLTDSDVATIILDMLIAGVDTTAHSVAFTLYLLARNPEKQSKLQSIIDTVTGHGADAPVTTQHLSDMPYLGHVFRESLRLFPLTTGTNRLLTEDIELSGYRVPAGTLVYGFQMQMSRDSQYFDRPDEFLPERWERSRPHGAVHPYASLPFSHGKRMCVGKRIAEQEVCTFLVRTMQRYTVSLESSQEMSVLCQVVLKPDIPLAFKFTKRN